LHVYKIVESTLLPYTSLEKAMKAKSGRDTEEALIGAKTDTKNYGIIKQELLSELL